MTHSTVLSQPAWIAATTYLSERDPVLAGIIQAYPNERLLAHDNPFQTLVRAIIGQQISVGAAATIWSRLIHRVSAVSATEFAKLSVSDFKACGLTQAKITGIQGTITFFKTHVTRPDYFKSCQDNTRKLLTLTGIGPWTLSMFQLFHRGDADILPLTDIGLLNAVNKAYDLVLPRPDLVQWLRSHAKDQWSPYCSVATWYLWRTIDPTVVIY